MKNTDEQGEAKSAPPEVTKLPRSRCMKCGLVGVSSIVTAGACRNTVACAKRHRRAVEDAGTQADG